MGLGQGGGRAVLLFPVQVKMGREEDGRRLRAEEEERETGKRRLGIGGSLSIGKCREREGGRAYSPCLDT